MQTSLGGLNLTASHERYFQYQSEQAPKQGNAFLDSRSSLRADLVLKPSASLTVPIAATIQHRQTDTGSDVLAGSFRASTALGPVSGANEINVSLSRQPTRRNLTASGTTLLNFYSRFAAIRAELAYTIKPEARIARATTTVDVPINDRFGLRLGGGYEFANDTANMSAGVNYKFDHFAVGSFARYSTDGSYEAGFNLTASFAKNPDGNNWSASSKNLARSGVAAARAFIDSNADKVFNDGDTILENAQFKINGRPVQNTIGSKNGTTLVGLAAYEPAQVSIDMRSIDDPYLIGASALEHVIAPRPGSVAVIDIPLSPSGEIVGIILLKRDTEIVAIGDVDLELRNAAGDLIATTSSEFDGYFVFERIPFNDYQLTLSPEQSARLGIELTKAPQLSLNPQNDIIENVKLEVSKTMSEETLEN